jgi:hypothetical protein
VGCLVFEQQRERKKGDAIEIRKGEKKVLGREVVNVYMSIRSGFCIKAFLVDWGSRFWIGVACAHFSGFELKIRYHRFSRKRDGERGDSVYVWLGNGHF